MDKRIESETAALNLKIKAKAEKLQRKEKIRPDRYANAMNDL